MPEREIVYLDDYFDKDTMLELLNSIPEEEYKPSQTEKEFLRDLHLWKERSIRMLGDRVLGEPSLPY